MSQEVEFARQPAGGLEESFESSGLEQGQLGAGQTEAVGEIGGDLLPGERRQVIAHDDALREGLMHGHGEAPSQLGLAEQQKAEPVFGVHLVVGQQAEVFEDFGSKMMGLVNDQDGAAAGFGNQTRDLASDLARWNMA